MTGMDRLEELYQEVEAAGPNYRPQGYRTALERELLQLWPQLQAAEGLAAAVQVVTQVLECINDRTPGGVLYDKYGINREELMQQLRDVEAALAAWVKAKDTS